MNETQLRARLHESSEEFRRIEEKHQQYEDQLEALSHMSLSLAEEQVKKNELKKLKLQMKDKMFELMDEFQKSMGK